MRGRTRPVTWWVLLTALAICNGEESDESSAEVQQLKQAFKAPDSGLSKRLEFVETFQGSDAEVRGRWILSQDPKYKDQNVKFDGSDLPDLKEDRGIYLVDANHHYGVSATFDKPIDTAGKDFVVQYETQFGDGLICGGAYIKILRDEPELSVDGLTNDTPYSIMFGPDKCGATNKVHFIFQHQNPITKKWEEKHFTKAPQIKSDKGFHLYTLAVKKDNSFEIFIDNDSAAKGNLLQDMEPPVNPPAEIDDSSDRKPADWVDDAKIEDPSARKPDDWDEDAPARIPDESVSKPEGWLEDEPRMVPDPEASKPDDWDDEEDGAWEAVLVENPKCTQGPGCGEWTRPMKANPDYKGKWKAPMIDNPEYKGVWRPRQIANPEHFEDKHPSNFARMAGVAVEVWTTNPKIFMDNFVIGHDLDAAQEFAEQTWRPKFKSWEHQEKEQKKEAKRKARETETQEVGIKGHIHRLWNKFLDLYEGNTTGVIASLTLGALSVLFLVWSALKPRARGPATRPGSRSALRVNTSESDLVPDGVEESKDSAPPAGRAAPTSPAGDESDVSDDQVDDQVALASKASEEAAAEARKGGPRLRKAGKADKP